MNFFFLPQKRSATALPMVIKCIGSKFSKVARTRAWAAAYAVRRPCLWRTAPLRRHMRHYISEPLTYCVQRMWWDAT